MALDGTLAGLKVSLARLVLRSDLSDDDLNDFIVTAESQMDRRFVSRISAGLGPPRRLIGRSDAAFSLATEYVAVPNDIRGPLQLLLTATVGGAMIELDYLDDTNFQNLKVNGYYPGYRITQPATGCPKYYTIVGTQLQILPVADQAYTGEMTYIAKFPRLTASNTTNWILADYPDAYLYGMATASGPFLKMSAADKQDYAARFQIAVDDICNADPMPTDKSILRTDVALVQRWSRGGAGRYNINADGI